MSKKRFLDLISNFRKQRVLVVGDLMLDEWIWGKVSRISPEAPVPVVQVEKRTFSLGGASNVAANLRGLGASTTVAGIVGQDEPGRVLKRKLRENKVDLQGLSVIKGRPTTLKTRIIAHNQQVVRADAEVKTKLSLPHAEKVSSQVESLLDRVHAIIFSDYNKGCLFSLPVQHLIAKAAAKKKIVVAGPKPANVSLFAGASVMVLNQYEAEQVSGSEIQNHADLEKTGNQLLNVLKLKSLFITRGELGMTIFEPSKKPISFPAKATQVYDVSGAGDTVIAVAALALAAGATFQEAATLANHAAGVVVRKLGTAMLSPKELKETFEV